MVILTEKMFVFFTALIDIIDQIKEYVAILVSGKTEIKLNHCKIVLPPVI